MPLAVGRDRGRSAVHTGNGRSGVGGGTPNGVESHGGGARGARDAIARDGTVYAATGPSRLRVTGGLRRLTGRRRERTVTARGSLPRSVRGATTGGSERNTFSSCSNGSFSCFSRTATSPCGSESPSAGVVSPVNSISGYGKRFSTGPGNTGVRRTCRG